MKAYIINMKADTERLEQMRKRMAVLGMEYVVVEGFSLEKNNEGGLWARIRGSNEAHRVAMDCALKDGEKYALILEDDCIFRDDAVTLLKAALAEAETLEWDILFWGGAAIDGKFERITEHVARVGNIGGMHAYAFNLKSDSVNRIRALFDSLVARSQWMQGLSTEIGTQEHGLTRLAVRPFCVIQQNHVSGLDGEFVDNEAHSKRPEYADFVARSTEFRTRSKA